ncbi:N-acetylglucosamine-6-phosphate deacetylase [Pseudoalteromonas sp. 13-15]|uniref:N-acetylglucosamine-6-phosphate deacetylase n=1 Tax=Pseudoalteromonas TaxID=53246 RepID=UPI0007316114|nr:MULTISPECIES: N-acetylglucosamine-6-phosphate deacetylase [Pseudoalteromonas]AUL75364.1 N-acetylglucosamine-6-phosphate deacetylase [Pseudoalteromonas sp. 13-15]SIO23655.1 N-acetylglucosamine 6-phosphate deacetylase [Pseudoalteromonas marina]
MSVQRILVATLFDGDQFLKEKVLTIDAGVITAIDEKTNNVDETLSGLITPGFIDLQVNGGGGVLFNRARNASEVKRMLMAHAKYGTTAMLPTLITDTVEVMRQAADVIADAIVKHIPGIMGIHFEGPHLSIAKKGAHSEEFIRPISDDEWQVLSRKDIGKVVVTLAPENVLPSDITQMREYGIHVCLGHTNACFEQAQRAVDAGATGFTHLYNAMSPLQGREPGVVGCALLNDNAYCGLIVDGHHVDYATCQVALKAKPKGRVFLVTDAMPPVGTNETEFAFFDRTVTLNQGKLTSTTGELAGSVLDMATAVKNSVEHLQLPLSEALKMASLYPAQYINLPTTNGRLIVGSPANFVQLDTNQQVISTWIGGEQLFKK